ncbi:rod shape-determining protein [Pontibacter sp. E15-1]|uniref:rod shape-determining protein n=1 Tax=Pontibacter sp. E15-1 TaxID=2919918 RepID=UPI001F4F5666|nr:rod shape-determining protein [Pontibacter sp. E15-1]MCJ8165676.1 rod shape-determining protein [Pontibacter sp. E15-1]
MRILNFFTEDIAIDLGTANFLVVHKDRVVVDEPSIVAFDRRSGKTIAVGRKAMQMEGREHENIRISRPLQNGVIGDFYAAEHMIKGMLQLIKKSMSGFKPAYKMVVCVPAGITEVEKRAIRDSMMIAGAREVYLVHEPIAAAVGIGLDVEEPTGHMVIDIGGGTTEIAVIALSGIVCDQSVRVAGSTFDADIMHYVRQQHNILIGQPTAERVKLEVGAALQEVQNPPADFAIRGRDLMTGLPKQVLISYTDIACCLDRSLAKIEEAILKTLEITPPELSADIHHSGIYLTGGGALLRGLDKRISSKTKLPTHVVENPLLAVVRGTGIALKNIGRFRFLMR